MLTLIPFTRDCIRYQRITRENVPEGYDFPKLSDIHITAISAIAFAIIEIAFKKVMPAIFSSCCKEQDDLEMKEFRMEKACDQMYRFIYELIVTFWGW